ncbi:hypothetical protein LUD75_13580 [Epilithonimonas sp. JDS]|uniref:hypothetical protein n=1 Tax=Epilithonimonas sp. JDS TaxID=2902797 RepID=UPI001E2F5630|nr:hypothetical protein [Epilithonimonas sp. JDS]MCD9855749.1 hypothetical protein [Epilithonimonas sp. JDS]
MKKLRDKIEHFTLSADKKWKSIPAERQRFLTKLFFAGYAVITLLMLISIFHTTGNNSNTISISHIMTISDHITVKKPAQ